MNIFNSFHGISIISSKKCKNSNLFFITLAKPFIVYIWSSKKIQQNILQYYWYWFISNILFYNCNYSSSPHKLQVHVANQQHQAAAVLFTHLQKMEASIEEEKRAYNCTLCKFSSPGKPALMGHVRTMKHLQMEQIHQLQKRAEGNTSHTEIGDIFQVTENSAVELDHSSERPNNNDDPRGKFMCTIYFCM